MRRSLSAFAAAFLVAAVAPIAAPIGTATTAFAATSVVLDGHGYGHGVGLSQWGAYGYAVDYGWSATQILDRYYGGTVSATSDVTTINVRLMNEDDLQTAVVNEHGLLVVDGVAGGPWRSVLARETSNGVYAVWARSDAQVCPSASGDPVASGWTLVAGGVASFVNIRTTANNTTTNDFADLPAVCEPNGNVRTYRGIIRAINGTAGENRTVNEVPIEQFLRSVIAKEMSPSWAAAGGGKGAQALQAQAIAARSYALAENRYSYARTCDLVCQTYLGAAMRGSVGGTYTRIEYPQTDAAVAATAGVVRRVGSTSGAIAYAMFSASSGGWTAPTSLGFTPNEDLGDATASNPNHNWSVTITGAAIQAKYPAIGTFTDLTVLARNGYGDWGGRVTSVRVSGTAGSVTVTGDQLRTALSLRSNWFNVRGTTEPPPVTPPANTCGSRVPPTITTSGGTADPALFTPITPLRLIDTRTGLGTDATPLGAGCTLIVDPHLDPSVTAVAVNITTVDPAVVGHVTAYPCGQPKPIASVVQPLPRRTVAGATVVPLGDDGTFCVFSYSATPLVIDLFGSYAPDSGDPFQPVNPRRLFDSRNGARVNGGTVVRVPVVGAGAAPAGSTAVALTVHASNASGEGFVTVFPCDTAMPLASSTNVWVGGSVANHVDVRLSTSGDICLYSFSSVHLVVDLSGWYGNGATTRFTAITPVRVMDTRENLGTTGMFAAKANRRLQLAGTFGLPPAGTLKGVVAEVTEADATAVGYVTVHPCQTPVPDLSMVRYSAEGASANVVTGIVDATGGWCLMPSTATHLLVDVSGYFS